jgi:hypothetical protein
MWQGLMAGRHSKREAHTARIPAQRGLVLPLSPLAQLVEEFVTAAVPCPDCEVSAGASYVGPVRRPRRSAALERYMARPDGSVLR